MAFMRVEMFSSVLHTCVSADVVIPQAVSTEIGMASREAGGRHPVLWLLHGSTDDHTTWQRRTSIERYAAQRGLAVVMPAAELSAYANMAHGGDFYHYVAEELPQLMRSIFPLSDRREDNFIAGNSMGGYGAMKIGINHPDRYGAIGCFSAGASNGKPRANKSGMFTDERWRLRNFMQTGGKDMEGTLEDTCWMARQNLGREHLPRIYHTCGRADFLLDDARRTRDFFMSMEGNPYQYEYREYEGDHSWEYWDAHITDFLDWLNLDDPGVKIVN